MTGGHPHIVLIDRSELSLGGASGKFMGWWEGSRCQGGALVDVSGGDLELFEQNAILEDQRREKEVRDEQERAEMDRIRNTRPRAVLGFDSAGNPVYDDDPGMMTNWGE